MNGETIRRQFARDMNARAVDVRRAALDLEPRVREWFPTADHPARRAVDLALRACDVAEEPVDVLALWRTKAALLWLAEDVDHHVAERLRRVVGLLVAAERATQGRLASLPVEPPPARASAWRRLLSCLFGRPKTRALPASRGGAIPNHEPEGRNP